MNDSGEPITSLDPCDPLTKWVDELQGVLKVTTDLIEASDRHRAVAESAQRKCAELREEVAKLRAENEHYRGLAQSSQHERDQLREEVTELLQRLSISPIYDRHLETYWRVLNLADGAEGHVDHEGSKLPRS